MVNNVAEHWNLLCHDVSSRPATVTLIGWFQFPSALPTNVGYKLGTVPNYLLGEKDGAGLDKGFSSIQGCHLSKMAKKKKISQRRVEWTDKSMVELLAWLDHTR